MTSPQEPDEPSRLPVIGAGAAQELKPMTFAVWLCVGLSVFIAVVLAVVSGFRLSRVIGLWPVMAFGAGMWFVVLLLASGHSRDRP